MAWVWIDEACLIPTGKTPTQDVKTRCLARMRGLDLFDIQLFITSTHEGELTWPNEDWVANPKPHHTYFRGSTFDNRYMRHYAKGLLELLGRLQRFGFFGYNLQRTDTGRIACG